MTRETKIGLLVGLAFIIVIGILLSDHINTSGEPVRADATNIYETVKGSVNAPNSRQTGASDVVIAPQPVVPQNRVATQIEPEARQNPGTTQIQISPGGDPSQLQFPTRMANGQGPVDQGPVTSAEGTGQASDNSPVKLSDPNQGTNNDTQANGTVAVAGGSAMERLANEARQHNMELVNRDGTSVGISTGPIKAVVTPVAHPEGRQITAEENDTVSKFASKYMGANTKANREAIIAANPTVGPDGSKVFAGRTYLIPAPAATVPAPTAVQPPQQVAQAPVPPPQHPPVKAAAPTVPGTVMYTVKQDDTLWKIASEQLGSGARYSEIQDMNADVLKGKADVRPNMRLKLPAKGVATSN